MKNLVLTGFMGTGKSTVGKIIAKKLGYRFIDSDTEIEKAEQRSMQAVFDAYGEDGFREIESRIIEEISKKSNSVIATGGGVVLRKENMENLRRNGIIMLLRTNVDVLAQRLADKADRPLAKGKSVKELSEILHAREPYYADCDFALDIGDLSPMNIADKMIDMYKKL